MCKTKSISKIHFANIQKEETQLYTPFKSLYNVADMTYKVVILVWLSLFRKPCNGIVLCFFHDPLFLVKVRKKILQTRCSVQSISRQTDQTGQAFPPAPPPPPPNPNQVVFAWIGEKITIAASALQKIPIFVVFFQQPHRLFIICYSVHLFVTQIFIEICF